MSIPQVEVNMEGIFTSGQAYVALSRATSAEGLSITGYSSRLVFSNSAAIQFYRGIERELMKRVQSGEEVPSTETVTTSIAEMCSN